MEYSQYAILTQHPAYVTVIEWARKHELKVFIHLNRTRFFIPDQGLLHTEFMLRYSEYCIEVIKGENLVTGRVENWILKIFFVKILGLCKETWAVYA
jgi:hypothetical protein